MQTFVMIRPVAKHGFQKKKELKSGETEVSINGIKL